MNREIDINDIIDDFDASRQAKKSFTRSGTTPNSKENIYDQLVRTMINERMSPELLPFNHVLLNEVLLRISEQQQYLLDSHDYGDTNAGAGVITADHKLQLMIIETEIERLSYLVRIYLRVRLSKIDQFTIFYINKTAQELTTDGALLSDPEMEYMQEHFKIITQLYNNSFLKKLPHFLRLLDDTSGGESMVSEPDIDRPVFIKVVTNTPIMVKISEDEVLELVKGGIYVIRYKLIQEYVRIGDILLI